MCARSLGRVGWNQVVLESGCSGCDSLRGTWWLLTPSPLIFTCLDLYFVFLIIIFGHSR